VASASIPAGRQHFGVLAASAPCGLGDDALSSGSTHQPRLVTLVDVAPTFLSAVGVDPPTAMTGAPARPSSGGQVSTLLADDRKATTTDAARLPWIWTIVAVNVLGAVVAVRRPDLRARVALALLAVPPASFLVMLVPWWRWGVVPGLVAGAAIAAALAVVTAAAAGHRPQAAVVVMVAATAVLLLVDLLGNGWLEREAPLGSSPLVAARFYGLGNAGLGLLAASSILIGGWALRRWGRRSVLWVAGGLVVIAVIAVAPMFGAKVGAAATLVPAFALLVVDTSRRRHLGTVAAAGAVAAVALLAVAALADAHLSPLHRTHLARLVSRRDLLDAVARKASAAVRNTGNPLNLVLAVAVACIVLARVEWRRHPLRGALASLVAAAVIGSLFNDSGLVVGASVAAIAWPALLALGSSPTPTVQTGAAAGPAPGTG
jgi:hypothetical protein